MSNVSYEVYEHHGRLVRVRADLRGRHREMCLCYDCLKFRPDSCRAEGPNCPIAQAIYENCVRFGVTTPVFECPEFVEAE